MKRVIPEDMLQWHNSCNGASSLAGQYNVGGCDREAQLVIAE